MASDVSSETYVHVSEKVRFSQVKLIKDASLVAMYSAMAVASSLFFVAIPNLETITLFIFLVAYRHGVWRGLNMAFLTLILYEFVVASIWGSAGILFLFKFPPQILTVLAGTLTAHVLKADLESVELSEGDGSSLNLVSDDIVEEKIVDLMTMEMSKKGRVFDLTVESLIFGLIGFSITLIYDVFTSLSFLVFTPEIRSESLLLAFLLGIPFYLFHEITNFVLFMTIPTLNRALNEASRE